MLRKLVALAAFGAMLLGSVGVAQARTVPKTHVRINHSSITVGSSATISGSVSPKLRGHVVYLQRRTHGRWHSVAHRKLSATSKYAFRVRPKRSGTYVYRVLDPRTRSGLPASHSRTVRLVVRAHRKTSCTPGYSPCIPPGPDVDCAGGSGNGPRYVHGPVYVTGSDPYDLDRDGDGVACESP